MGKVKITVKIPKVRLLVKLKSSCLVKKKALFLRNNREKGNTGVMAGL